MTSTMICHMDVGCVEDSLSPAQTAWIAKIKQDHSSAVSEIEQLQKGSVKVKRINPFVVEVQTKQMVTIKAKKSVLTNRPAISSPVVTSVEGGTLLTSKQATFKKITLPPAPPTVPVAGRVLTLPSPPRPVSPPTAQTVQATKTLTVRQMPTVQTSPALRPILPAPPQVSYAVELVDKNHVALVVSVQPSKVLPQSVITKKRAELDSFVKSKLVMSPRVFVEWLLQVGLIKSSQSGSCPAHPTSVKPNLNLAISCEENRFPNSGGYVWISPCCGETFVSVFTGSIFKGSPLAPQDVLKLVYHWCCQTPLKNLLQWVKVDKSYLDEFYAMLRGICTLSIQTSTPRFGPTSTSYVEIGVISLGTTSADGKKRDVKVEVLGIYDRDTRKMRLRASEPVTETGPTRRHMRFMRIFKNLHKWVSPEAILLIDTTIDTGVLNELGFRMVIQKNLATTPQDFKFTNKTIMDYLRKTVPRAFINTLTVLPLNTIQQFLDELVWRENYGTTPTSAFHSMIRDISSETLAPGVDIVRRLKEASVYPFEDWSEMNTEPAAASLSTPVSATVSAAAKRTAATAQEGPSPTKQSKTLTHFGTLLGKNDATDEINDNELKCQYAGCGQLLHSNLETMEHLRYHAARDAGRDGSVRREQCRYCLEDFSSAAERKEHVQSVHILTDNILRTPDGKIENVTLKKDCCVLCSQVFPVRKLLDQHIRNSHVLAELPYKCRVCNYRTSIHADVVQHFYEEHRKTSHLLCPVCLDTYVDNGDVAQATGGLGSAHLQYLTHISAHMMVPAENAQQCPSCVLRFLQSDQLSHHVRMDHASLSKTPGVKSFTYSYRFVPPLSTSSPGARALERPGSSVARTGQRASPKSGKKAPSKEPKDPLDDTVVRKYVGLTVDKQIGSDFLCIECSEPLLRENHFTAYHCCPLCRFATSCRMAMARHKQNAHKNDENPSRPIGGSVFVLSGLVHCGCGFSSRDASTMEQHVADCAEGKFSLNPPELLN